MNKLSSNTPSCVKPSQVQREIDRINTVIDQLEKSTAVLGERISSSIFSRPVETNKSEAPRESLAPLAGTLQKIGDRVETVVDQLDSLTSTCEL